MFGQIYISHIVPIIITLKIIFITYYISLFIFIMGTVLNDVVWYGYILFMRILHPTHTTRLKSNRIVFTRRRLLYNQIIYTIILLTIEI